MAIFWLKPVTAKPSHALKKYIKIELHKINSPPIAIKTVGYTGIFHFQEESIQTIVNVDGLPQLPISIGNSQI